MWYYLVWRYPTLLYPTGRTVKASSTNDAPYPDISKYWYHKCNSDLRNKSMDSETIIQSDWRHKSVDIETNIPPEEDINAVWRWDQRT